MQKEELESTLASMSRPVFSGMAHETKLRLAVMSTKRSAKISLWLLLIPFIFLAEGIVQSLWHVSLPPWSWIQRYSPKWPVQVRMAIFMLVLIIIPLLAAVINFLSVIWFQYDKQAKVLHISVRIRRVNLILMTVAALIAFLFIAHTLIEWLTNGI